METCGCTGSAMDLAGSPGPVVTLHFFGSQVPPSSITLASPHNQHYPRVLVKECQEVASPCLPPSWEFRTPDHHDVTHGEQTQHFP